MKTALLFLLIFFLTDVSKSQTRIVYINYGFVIDSAYEKAIKNLFITQYGPLIDTNDLLIKRQIVEIRKEKKILNNSLEKYDTISAFRHSDTAILNSPYSTFKLRAGVSLINLSTNDLEFTSVNLLEEHSRREKTQLINNEFGYEIKKISGDSIILGYKCEKYIVNEFNLYKNQKTHIRTVSIWSTNKIIPTIPIYCLMWFHKKILNDYTPLFIEENTAINMIPCIFIIKAIAVSGTNPINKMSSGF